MAKNIRELEAKMGPERVARGKAMARRERWLYENPEALASVMRGLEQAKRGELGESVDLDKTRFWEM